jgi:acetylornithine deacetylase/succinyl-diaminopimelate desuccinylase-like protein
MKRLVSKLDEIKKKNPKFKYELEIVSHTKPIISNKDSAVIKSLQKALKKVTGNEVPVTGSPGGGDMRWTVPKWTETVGFGAGYRRDASDQKRREELESDIHGIDEKMNIKVLTDSAKVVALAAIDLLGTIS